MKSFLTFFSIGAVSGFTLLLYSIVWNLIKQEGSLTGQSAAEHFRYSYEQEILESFSRHDCVIEKADPPRIFGTYKLGICRTKVNEKIYETTVEFSFRQKIISTDHSIESVQERDKS